MASIGIYPDSIVDEFRKPGVFFLPLAKFEFDGGANVRRFAYSYKNFVVDGETYEGFGSVDALKMIGIGDVKQPRTNVAAAVNITMTGVDYDFISQVRGDVDVIYGSAATLYDQLYDINTYQPIGSPVVIFKGFCGMPTFTAKGSDGTRTITLSIDSDEASKNFAPGGLLTDADQKLKDPTDRGLELVGASAAETIK